MLIFIEINQIKEPELETKVYHQFTAAALSEYFN